MTTNETITITETAPDGTETTVEITTTRTDEAIENGEPSLVEEIVEALLDEESSDGDYAAEQKDSDIFIAAPETPPETIETASESGETAPVMIDESGGDSLANDPFSVAPTISEPTAAPEFAPFAAPDENSTASADEVANAEAAETEAHAEAAREAQAAADEFIAEGDYAAAAEAREAAENAAHQAGDDSMLSAYDSADLENAAYQQEIAEDYNDQQAELAEAGDYEAAREASGNAAYHTGNADMLAGGADHTGRADAEEYQMEWAVWEEGNAEYNAQAAEEYAAQGDFDNAEYHAGEAAEHQAAADYHGDLGEHGGDMAVYDPSSDVASGGSYDSSSAADDYSTDYSTE